MYKSWIEPVLDRHLRPVAAPRELWDRVNNPVVRPRPVAQWKLAFALLLVVATAWALHPRGASIDSDRASEIEKWVNARCGLNIALTPSQQIQLLGARQLGTASAEIRYRLHEHESTLLLSKVDQGGHHGQAYTIVSADLQNACLLCHAE